MSAKIVFLAAFAFAAFCGASCCPFCGCGAAFPPPCAAPLLPPYLPAPAPAFAPLAPWALAPVSSCGPAPSPLPILQVAPVVAPTIDQGTVALPHAPIPAPQTIAHKCVCTKTVVKPQVVQRCIAVPSVQRYLKKFYTPVVENIAYQARPTCAQGPAPAAPLLPPCAPALPPFLPPCAPALPPFLPPCAPALPPFLPPCAPALPPFLPPCAPALPPCLPPCPAFRC